MARQQGWGLARGNRGAGHPGRRPGAGWLQPEGGVGSDWDDPASPRRCAGCGAGRAGTGGGARGRPAGGGTPLAWPAVAAARQIRDQDVQVGPDGIAERCARVWPRTGGSRIEDAQMRHGRKTRVVRFDGYKRHVLTGPGHRLVPAVGVTASQRARGRGRRPDRRRPGPPRTPTLGELHIDRAYLASSLVRGPRPRPGRSTARRGRSRNGPRFTKTAFTLDFDQRLLTCPNRSAMAFHPGRQRPVPRQLPAQPARCAASAPPAPAAAACQSTPTSPCWSSSAPRSRPRRAGPGCASASRSSTAWPTSAAGKAAALATSARQEPLRPAPRRRRPQPSRHRPPSPTSHPQQAA